jgi:hypothetical protein
MPRYLASSYYYYVCVSDYISDVLILLLQSLASSFLILLLQYLASSFLILLLYIYYYYIYMSTTIYILLPYICIYNIERPHATISSVLIPLLYMCVRLYIWRPHTPTIYILLLYMCLSYYCTTIYLTSTYYYYIYYYYICVFHTTVHTRAAATGSTREKKNKKWRELSYASL